MRYARVHCSTICRLYVCTDDKVLILFNFLSKANLQLSFLMSSRSGARTPSSGTLCFNLIQFHSCCHLTPPLLHHHFRQRFTTTIIINITVITTTFGSTVTLKSRYYKIDPPLKLLMIIISLLIHVSNMSPKTIT